MLDNLTNVITTTFSEAFTHCVFLAFVAVSYLFFLVLQLLPTMFYSSCLLYLMEIFLLRKKGKEWPTYECAQIVSLEAKKAVAGRTPSLS